MPRGNGTGPVGAGPMTGRALGYCAGRAAPGYANPEFGRMGFRRGGGFGGRPDRGMAWRRGFAATPPAYLPSETPRSTSPEDEKRYLGKEL